MALESSLVPIPSELVMIPAGYLAAQGSLDPLLATLAGGSGSLLGASANYLFGRYAGRAFLLRYGKYFLIDERKYHEAEKLFLRNAQWATFIGRFIQIGRAHVELQSLMRISYAVFCLKKKKKKKTKTKPKINKELVM